MHHTHTPNTFRTTRDKTPNLVNVLCVLVLEKTEQGICKAVWGSCALRELLLCISNLRLVWAQGCFQRCRKLVNVNLRLLHHSPLFTTMDWNAEGGVCMHARVCVYLLGGWIGDAAC